MFFGEFSVTGGHDAGIASGPVGQGEEGRAVEGLVVIDTVEDPEVGVEVAEIVKRPRDLVGPLPERYFPASSPPIVCFLIVSVTTAKSSGVKVRQDARAS